MEENGDEGDEDDDDDEDMDETDIEGILDGEFDEDDDLDDEEEETEEDAADRLRSEIVDRFDEDNAKLGIVQVCRSTMVKIENPYRRKYLPFYGFAAFNGMDFIRIHGFARHC